MKPTRSSTAWTRPCWASGARITTTVTGFTVDGQRLHEDDRQFTLEGDEPRELGATDRHAAPAEQLMHAVASCVAATTVAYAALFVTAWRRVSRPKRRYTSWIE